MRRKTSRNENLQALERSLPFRMKRLHRLFDQVGDHNYFPTIDRSGRLYTVLVQLPEPVRHFLTYKGEQLAAVDVKNSQPALLCHLFGSRFWDTKAHRVSLKSIQPSVFSALEKAGTLQKIREHVRKARHSADVKQYVAQTTSGTWYEHLVERYGGRHQSMSTRAGAKRQFMKFMYFNSAYKSANRYGAYRQWATDFPNVATLLELVKQDNHTYLARMLQALEAKLLLRLVAGEFVKKHPGIYIGPVHDSLITLKSKMDDLKAILEEVYHRELHLVPMLDVKVLSPENAYRELPGYIKKKIKCFPVI